MLVADGNVNNKISMLCTLNCHNVICQLYLNKAGEKNNIKIQ